MALNSAALRTRDLTHSRGALAKEQLPTLVPLGTDCHPGCLHTLGQTPRPLPRPAALAAGQGPAPQTEPCGPGRARCLTHGFLSLRKLGAKVFPQSIFREHSYPITAQEQGAHSGVGM